MFESVRRVMFETIEENGRAEGAPIVTFPERMISVEGEDMYVGQKPLEWLLDVSAFYLSLPPNTYGVVVYPDGTSHDMPGGLHKVPAGVYSLYYVDKRERTDTSEPVSEITTDGEKLTLQVILRYRVTDPLLALSIAHPIETLINHIETDVAQYIRTHHHSEIADSSDNSNSRLFAFFSERHERRTPLSDAISITGIELKEFTGDKEYVELRRKVRMSEQQSQLERQQAEYQQELNRLKAQHKVENENVAAEHQADLERNAAEHKAEKEKIEARHQKEMQDILMQVKLREIDLENKRVYLQTQTANFAQVIEAITHAFASGVPMNASVIKHINDLFTAYKEEVDKLIQSDSSAEQKPSTGEKPDSPAVAPSTGSDKVEKLTHTLLNLLKPRK